MAQLDSVPKRTSSACLACSEMHKCYAEGRDVSNHLDYPSQPVASLNCWRFLHFLDLWSRLLIC